MDTASLKAFATKARTDLMKGVAARLEVVLAPGSNARAEQPGSVAALERAVAQTSRDAVVDRVAYTWFNRIIALRFMDAKGYTGVGVISPEVGKTTGQPQVLSEAKGGDFDIEVVSASTQAAVTSLLAPGAHGSDPQGAAYALLLEAYCRFWNKAMPFMFEREGDYTELLIPTGLLSADSVRGRAVAALTEDVCDDVEVIGWLYQFYISERKDEVFDGFKKNKKAGAAEIPAATQLFTPHWIVRYLVENSLGRLWLLNHPHSHLADQMYYYIKPAEDDIDFLKVTKPEELKIIDPAVGSGHMLSYAFDLLYAIYEEEGYTPSEIPGLILEHNLFGTEIDPRAGALAAFALIMKAAARRKLFLKGALQPNICVLENVSFDPSELDYLWSLTKGGSISRADADEFWKAFEHADTFGSLIQTQEHLVALFSATIDETSAEGDLLNGRTLEKAISVLNQAEFLSRRYQVVVANPPYMSQASMGDRLARFVTGNFIDAKADLGIAFVYRNLALVLQGGFVGMITLQSWMFLTSFVAVRARVTKLSPPLHLLHLGTGAFDSIGGAVVATSAYVLGSKSPDVPAEFFKLTVPQSEAGKSGLFRKALTEESPDVRYLVAPKSFMDISGAPMAYWLSDFESFKRPHLVTSWRSGGRLKTHDTVRYVRYWWEVSLGSKRWRPLVKGGEFRRWHGNRDFVVDWAPESVTEYESHGGLYPDSSRGKPGITWTMISSEPGFRLKAANDEFDSASPTIMPTLPTSNLLSVLGYLNSAAALEILAAINPTINNRVTDILELPVPEELEVHESEIQWLAERAVRASRTLDAMRETTPDIAEAPVLLGQWVRVADAVEQCISVASVAATEIIDSEHALDVIFPSGGGFTPKRGWQGTLPDTASSAADLVSFAIGCMFGRYSLDKPGLIIADEGSTLKDYLEQVPTPSFMPDEDNVIPIVDGDWFEDDIVAKFRQFLRAAFGEQNFAENLTFLTDSLGVKDLRDYFTKTFYKDHVQRYKKRPIYWLFSSPKGSFNALVYLHRYNPSTVSTVLNDYLREFIKKMEAELSKQEHSVANGAGAREIAASQKEADRIRKVLIELNDYERELYDLASQQISLDLDNGVLVNYQKFGTALKDIGLKKGGADG